MESTSKEINKLRLEYSKEILDEKIIYIKNNSSIEDQIIQIHSLSKYAKIENTTNAIPAIVIPVVSFLARKFFHI